MEKAALVYKDKIYAFDGENLSIPEQKEVTKFRVGAVFPSHLLLSLSFKLPLSTPKDQLDLQVELKMYNEGGLDPNKEYLIDYISYELINSDIVLIEAFAIEKEYLDERFAKAVKELGFIDVLFPRFIAYESLYDSESPYSDLYLYLSDEESFAAIYQKGKFIGFRQLDNLSKIAQKSGIELVKLKTLLSQKGLEIDRYTPDEMHIYDTLSEVFYKNVEKIVYAVNFKRSYFGIERVDRVIVDFEGATISGLAELFTGFGYENIKIQPLECCNRQKDAAVLVLANYLYRYEHLEQRLNFSIFERKKPLYRYTVVKLAAALLLLLLLLGVGGRYLSVQTQELDKQIVLKSRQLNDAKKRAKRYLSLLQGLKTKAKGLKQKIKHLQDEAQIYQATLDIIPFMQEAKLTRERMINDIVEGLYIYRLSSQSIDQNSSRYSDVKLVSTSNERDKIAKFMDYLYQKGYKKVTTRSIVSQKGVYESVVRVER